MAGPIFATWRLDNTVPKKHRSGGEPLATLCLILPIRESNLNNFRTDSDVFNHYAVRVSINLLCLIEITVSFNRMVKEYMLNTTMKAQAGSVSSQVDCYGIGKLCFCCRF